MLSLLVILVAAPGVYDQALRLPAGSEVAEIALLAALTGFIALLAFGVVRRWRWAFWLILVAFLGGTLRVPVAILQITGPGLPPSGSALGVAEEGGTIAIQATTMPPCRRSPDDLRATLRMSSYAVPVEEGPENIASLTRTQRTRVPPATTPHSGV